MIWRGRLSIKAEQRREAAMKETHRLLLRGVSEKSKAAVKISELCQGGAANCLSVEWKSVVRAGSKVVSFFAGDKCARIMREDDTPVPGWQGTIECDPRYVLCQINSLARLGLWELNDFRPDQELLDGEYYIVRAIDLINNRETDAALFCPGEAMSADIRRITRRLSKLIDISPREIVMRSRLHKFHLGWLVD